MDYVSIRVSTLRGDQKIDFNAYIKVADKMILYLRRGDSFEGERLERLRSKKLKKMYILPDEELKYRNYLQLNIDSAYDDKSGKDLQTRSEIIQGAQQSNTEAVMEKPEDAYAYSETKEAAGKYVDFLLNNTDAVKSILNIDNKDQNIAHHGVSVSTLAVALAKKLGIVDQKQIQLLALGSLLHDMGHLNTTLNLSTPPDQFTGEDKKIYLKHPTDGAVRVQDKKHFDPLVVSIILQHEEHIDGTGFPMGLRENKIDPMSVIVGACNALDRLISFQGVPRNEAAKGLMMSALGRYPLKHLQLLADVAKTL